MKKAYILTFFYGANYGSKLQATALSSYLNNQGYEVCFIKTFLDPVFLFKHPSLLYTRIMNFIHRKERDAFFEPDPYKITEQRQQKIDQYNKENLSFISIKKHSQWQKILSEHPVFISGSDIIWQPASGYPEKYFLDFAFYTNCKRIAYAASVGAKTLPSKYTKYYKKYLGSYDAISVRENATKKLFEPIIDNKIIKVVDPTLLVDRKVWDDLSQKAEIPEKINPGKYILCYFVMRDDRYWNYVKLAKEATGLEVVVLPMHHQDEKEEYTVIDNGTPYEFIWLIRNAAFIITDSFHASVFSFLYEKEVYILKRARADEDEKYNDLLSRYGMEEQRVINENEFVRTPSFSYSNGRRILEMDRVFAMTFLNNAISNTL